MKSLNIKTAREENLKIIRFSDFASGEAGDLKFEISDLPRARTPRQMDGAVTAQFDELGSIEKTPEVQNLGEGNAGGLV